MPQRYQGPERERRALSCWTKLVRATNAIDAAVAPSLAEQGLTESQFGVLEALLHLGPMPQCDLARRILCTGGNLTLVVDKLEQRGLVRRARRQDDRRYVDVHLTPQGDALIREYFPAHARLITERFAVLTRDEQLELGRLCRKLGLRAEAPAVA